MISILQAMPQALRASLPTDYLLLLQAPGAVDVMDPTLNKAWRLYRPRDLLEEVRVLPAPPVPTYRQLVAYATALASAGIVEGGASSEPPMLTKSVADASFAIAEDNGDILFLRLDRNSEVWCFWHDGADIHKLCASVSDLHTKA